MTRFAIYETVKNQMVRPGHQMPFYQKVLLGGGAGCIGGFFGTPADLINVRYKKCHTLILKDCEESN